MKEDGILEARTLTHDRIAALQPHTIQNNNENSVNMRKKMIFFL